MTTEQQSNWNSFARTNASARFRKQSARMGTPLTELIVREARVETGMRVLDVASGTGEPAISIATLLNETGEVVATDISEEPLKIAKGRAQQRVLTNIRFQKADVHKLPFDDSQFDRVTSRLGLMFFADLPKALGEIRRVLKRGGRFTAVAWGPMQQPYFETTIGTILKRCPELELPPPGLKMFKFGPRGTLTNALREAGFSEASDELRTIDWTWHGTAEEVWDYFQAVTVPFAPLLQAIPQSRLAEINAAVINAIGKRSNADIIPFEGEFILSQAIR